MAKKDKIALRKPLAPKTDDADCKIAYEELLKEYAELNEWKVDGIDHAFGSDKAHVVSLEQYNARVGDYTAKRDRYNEKFSGQIETAEDVKANIKKILERRDAVDKANGDLRKWLQLLEEACEEESKFEEIQKAADEAFEYVAKHMLADGSGRMLTDEELEEREKRKEPNYV